MKAAATKGPRSQFRSA